MKASDFPAFEDQCRIPVSCARRSTTSGRVASSNTTTSGLTVRMTEASGAPRPAPPPRVLYERMRTLFVDERQERLIEQSSAELDHDVAGGLDVDRPSCHHHQR